MPVIIAKLRYFPLGEVAGPAMPILKADLDAISKKHGVTINLEEVKGKNAQMDGKNIREETMNSTIEEVSQSVITVTSENENSVKNAVTDLIKKYRAPRTVFGTLGSDEKGKSVVAGVCDASDGWY